jgi:hypothetical protein
VPVDHHRVDGRVAPRRGVDRLIGALLVLVVALMPDASINTASYWSGAALFLALYRTVAEADVDAPRRLALAGLVAAAACTLRQNYLPVAVGFLALVLVFRSGGRSCRRCAPIGGSGWARSSVAWSAWPRTWSRPGDRTRRSCTRFSSARSTRTSG